MQRILSGENLRRPIGRVRVGKRAHALHRIRCASSQGLTAAQKLYGGLQTLHHVEAGFLAQERVTKERNEIGGRMASGNVVCRQPRGLRDLLLAVAGIEEPAAQIGRRQGCRVIAARQGR
jgi:hypothetical protein